MKRTIFLLVTVSMALVAASAMVLAQGQHGDRIEANDRTDSNPPLRMPPPSQLGPPLTVANSSARSGAMKSTGPARNSGCTVFLVDDDWDFDPLYGANDGGRPYYTSTLDILGIGYGLWETEGQGEPSTADMADYGAVIWFTGYAYTWSPWYSFSPQNEHEVGQYLDTGGSFLLSSQDYYFEMDEPSPFMQNYLGILDIYDDKVVTHTVGVAGDPIGDGLGPYTLVRPDDWHAYWPRGIYEGPLDDEVYARPVAAEPFRYDEPVNINPNSTRYDSGLFRTVYLGWPFEWLDTLEQRARVMDAMLFWLGCKAAVELRPALLSGYGTPGSSVSYTLTVRNNGASAESYDIAYDGGWPVAGPSAVGPVAAGSSESFEVSVTIPAATNCFEMDSLAVTALAQSEPSSSTATLETTAVPAAIGGLTGMVYDANTDLGIVGALVSLDVADIHYEAVTAGDGSYQLSALPSCVYQAEFEATGYYSQAGVPIAITGGTTTTVDVALAAAWPVLSQGQVSVELPVHSTEPFTLTLSNVGSGDLVFSIDGEGMPWLAAVPTNGIVTPDQSRPIHLTFESDDLPWNECYTGTLGMGFNDPYSGTMSLPIEMCVVQCSPIPPSAPDLAPIDNPENDGTYTVSWSSVDCVLTYTLQEDDNAEFRSPFEVETSSPYQVSSQPTGTWHYRVRGTNQWGNSPWSNVQSTLVRGQARVYLPLVVRSTP